jgi:REP element-mobilizing transposase RayT
MTSWRKYSTLRLKGFDYSQPGAYFITICTKDLVCYFENVESKKIVRSTWNALPERFPTIILDEFVIMPNHLHFIIWFDPKSVGAQINCAPNDVGNDIPKRKDKISIGRQGIVDRSRPILGQVIRSFKSQVTRSIRSSGPVHFSWQRGYYDHIIRSEEALMKIREYIYSNPQRWHLDRNNPDSDGIDKETVELWDYLNLDHES